MGIKICPQCSGKVSDARSDCPHCNYDFNSAKKCPDCEEEVDITLEECPVCGYPFQQKSSKEQMETTISQTAIEGISPKNIEESTIEITERMMFSGP